MPINYVMENELPKKLFVIRKKILKQIHDYLRYTYPNEIDKNTPERAAAQIIADRYNNRFHHGLGIEDGL